jgi:hypothetical protein
MDIDSILEDDDLDVKILEVKGNDTNVSEETEHVIKPKALRNNPVEEHLLKQLHYVNNQIHQTKNNIELIEMVTKSTLEKLSKQSNYREDVSSESDSDVS